MALPSIERWVNRVGLVTGASTGIGAALCKTLVKHGMIIIGCARNEDKIKAIAEECRKLGYKGQLHSYKCDVSKEDEIEAMYVWIKSNHGGVDLCVNNAGFSNDETLLECTAKNMRDMLDVNVVGLALCTKFAVKSMKERGVNDGHIFNLNSMSGHRLTGMLNFYAATKFAVTALTEGFRRELVADTDIRITSISPGLVETEFLERAFDKNKSNQIYSTVRVMKAQDIADIILFALSAPANVQIHDVLVRPVGELK